MIHAMLLIRNEMSRELNKYGILSDIFKYLFNMCERIVVIDDDSDDGKTTKYLESFREFGRRYELYKSKEQMWEKNEVIIRKELWDLTVKKAHHNDWIICLDADELIDVDSYKLMSMLELLPQHIDGVGFRLFDMWDMDHYREDNHWKAHFYPWCFAVRYDENKEYKWHDKALHCGRFPANASERMLPTEIPVKHYGWSLEEDRKKKYDRYMRIDGEGKHGILAQYNSILDENPRLIRYGGDR
jgi:hypothetical protein